MNSITGGLSWLVNGLSWSRLGAYYAFTLSLNLLPNGGRKALTVWLPFAHDWETGVGDEGNARFATMTCSLSISVSTGIINAILS